MRRTVHTPDLSNVENITGLDARRSPYWNILEYCRHIGVEKLPSGGCRWMARIRRKDSGYSQSAIGLVAPIHKDGMNNEKAVAAAEAWFRSPDVAAKASQPFSVGTNRVLKYTKKTGRFTVGDSMSAFVEWKRVAAATTYFETTLSLINHHIIPRVGDLPVEDLSQEVFTQFCVDVLETAPKRGNRMQGPKVSLEDLEHEALRKRKKTLNTIIGLLRTAIEMSWENGDVECERT